MTDHVIELDLSCSQLVGKIDSNSSLFQLSHLQRLDLTHNNFSNSHISPEFGRFSNLTHLDLSLSSFSGQIPSQISYLSKLQSLRLNLSSETNLRLAAHDSELLLQNLTQLTELDLTGINISSTIPLNFSSHLTTLRFLYLSNCNFRGPIPESLSNLTCLEYLFLDVNTLNGTIPSGIFSLPSVIDLVLSNNHFSGQLEDFKSNSLRWIDLRNNQLQGHLPNSIQNVVNQTWLDLFSDLKHLWRLDLSYNSISLTNENKVNVTWPESLDALLLAACDVKELEVLRSAKHLRDLALSNNKLQGRIPDWAWSNWMFSLQHLNLSHNMLTSVNSIPLQNNLHGEIPQCLGKITALEVLDMCRNNLSGNLPTTFISGSSLRSLNLHGNKLEGKIPRSLANCKELQVLDLGDNHLIDKFPMWLGTLPKLQVLRLRSNELYGSIQPSTIENIFPELRIIDLSYNEFSGNLPTSLFQHLKAMRTIDPSIEAPRFYYSCNQWTGA
ncbi:hypothetical protein CQW23_28884 [Capsicum baccatum]|uniref:Uncharacterized protein n=1 Tax=Capsicum baccatum TaxID=33114 RepID=A0A2G2VHV4_CAPBA|nr:hypothetical protein CQW23_28884 [Capsicum baccatum]